MAPEGRARVDTEERRGGKGKERKGKVDGACSFENRGDKGEPSVRRTRSEEQSKMSQVAHREINVTVAKGQTLLRNWSAITLFVFLLYSCLFSSLSLPQRCLNWQNRSGLRWNGKKKRKLSQTRHNRLTERTWMRLHLNLNEGIVQQFENMLPCCLAETWMRMLIRFSSEVWIYSQQLVSLA